MSKINKNFIKAEKAMASGRYAIAIEHLNDLLKASPDQPKLLMMRGEAYLRSEHFELALVDYAKVVEADNKNITALVNFSVALIRCGQHENARNILEYVLELDPNKYDAYINLCNIYQTMGKSEHCLKLSLKAIELQPGSAIAYNNLGTAFGDLNMISEARESFKTALLINPEYAPTVINLAQIEVKLGNHDEAAYLYENILKTGKVSPTESDLVKYYLGYAYLHTGRIGLGWDFYEYGYGSMLPVASKRSKRKFIEPKWDGNDLGDARLLIWREQGLGDEIEFSTCLHELQKYGPQIILECEPRLVSIYKKNYPEFTVRAESISPDYFPLYQDFDIQCAIGSLPKFFRRDLESFSRSSTHVLNIDEKLIDKYKERLVLYRDKKLIGICWRSGLLSIARNDSYTALADWKELLTQEDFIFVNLQYGDCESEILEVEKSLGINILRWNDLDLKNDLENILGLIRNLDAVVTVGTAVSSLAGACNVPTFLLSKQSWMMLGQTERYPWFDCVTPLVAEQNAHLAEKIKFIPDLIRNLS